MINITFDGMLAFLSILGIIVFFLFLIFTKPKYLTEDEISELVENERRRKSNFENKP